MDTLARAIEIEERRGPPILGNIPLSRLSRIASYQRDLDQSRVNTLVSRWRQDAVGVLYVSRRSETLHVIIDGQHRAAALAVISGNHVDPLVPCLIYRNLTVEEEAELFVLYNGSQHRKQPAVYEVFRAELEAKNEDALGIVRVVESYGMRIVQGGFNTSSGENGIITALGAIRTIWRLSGESRLRDVFHVLHSAYGKERSGYRVGMLRGVDLFIERYGTDPNFSLDRLIDVLRRTDPTVITRRVQQISPPRANITVPSAFGRAIADFYNKGMRENHRLPEWAGEANALKGRGRRKGD